MMQECTYSCSNALPQATKWVEEVKSNAESVEITKEIIKNTIPNTFSTTFKIENVKKVYTQQYTDNG